MTNKKQITKTELTEITKLERSEGREKIPDFKDNKGRAAAWINTDENGETYLGVNLTVGVKDSDVVKINLFRVKEFVVAEDKAAK